MDSLEKSSIRENADKNLRANVITAIRGGVTSLTEADVSLRGEVYVLRPAVEKVVTDAAVATKDLAHRAQEAVRETLAGFRPDAESLADYYGTKVRERLSQSL